MSRTKSQKAQAKKLLKRPPGRFEQIDLSMRDHPEWMTRAYKNNRYVVMIDDNARLMGASVIKAMIQRHDDKPIPGHWRQLQNIKNELFGTEELAIEIYPPESKLTDKTNIYWLHILPRGQILNTLTI